MLIPVEFHVALEQRTVGDAGVLDTEKERKNREEDCLYVSMSKLRSIKLTCASDGSSH
jgi:hypothetical protein